MLPMESILAKGSSFGSTLGNTSLDERSEFSAEQEVDGDVFFEAVEIMVFVKSPFFGEFGVGGIKDEAKELIRVLFEDVSIPSCKSTVG